MGWIKKFLQENAKKKFLNAIKKNEIKKVQSLLHSHKNVHFLLNAQDENGRTPFVITAMKGYTKIAELLINSGDDINRSLSAQTTLTFASRNGKEKTVTLLINAGVDVNRQDGYGKTALMHVTVYGHTETATLLLNAGADINIKDNDGNTALIYAAINERTETVASLIHLGADANIQDRQGKTALDLLNAQKYPETAALLTDAMAHPEKYQKLTEADAKKLQQQIKAMSERELLDLQKEDPKLLQKIVLAGKLIETILPTLTPEQQKAFYRSTYNAVSPEMRKTMEAIIREGRLGNSLLDKSHSDNSR